MTSHASGIPEQPSVQDTAMQHQQPASQQSAVAAAADKKDRNLLKYRQLSTQHHSVMESRVSLHLPPNAIHAYYRTTFLVKYWVLCHYRHSLLSIFKLHTEGFWATEVSKWGPGAEN